MRQRKHRLAEMNVVPYIDVMLVLLIIFMITSPLLTQSVDVELPTTNQAKTIMPDERPIIVSIDAKGDIFLEYKDEPRIVSPPELVSEVKDILRDAPTSEVLLQGDKQLPYEEVINVMTLLKKAGVKKLGLLTRPKN